ncbi:MAG TPA: MarR family transcriptional regulator [Actinomycetales bacterium]
MVTPPPDAPRWLSTQESEAWLAFLMGTQALMAELDRQLLTDAGIPHSWYAVMVILSRQPDQVMSQTALASSAGFSLSRLSHTITRLEGRGWLRRVPHPTNRRTTNVELLAPGQAALDEMAPGHVAAVRAMLFDQLDEHQVDALRQIFQAVLAAAGPPPYRAPVV